MKTDEEAERGIPPKALYWNGYIMIGVGAYSTLIGFLEDNIGAYVYAVALFAMGLYARRKGLRRMRAEAGDIS